jgi:hypothetical protein
MKKKIDFFYIIVFATFQRKLDISIPKLYIYSIKTQSNSNQIKKTYLHKRIFCFVYDSAKYMSILRYKKHYFKLEKRLKY